MVRKILVFSLLFLFQQNLSAQNKNADETILKIPQANTSSAIALSEFIKKNYATDTARIRAIYIWVTNNINYDVAKLLARNSVPNPGRQSPDDVLKTRAAVCQGYADLFIEVCNQLAIPTVFVGGYTKRDQKVSPLAHAWVSAQLNGDWYLFDPTWGAGYLQNNQFIKAPNFKFYKLSPEKMISDHMPFDPMYQFLNYTITNKEFIEGKTSVNKGKVFFNYNDSLKNYNLLSQPQKARDETRRLEANDIANDMIAERLNFLKKGVSSHDFKDRYDDAGNAYKKAISLYNQYIDYKNKRFKTIDDKGLSQLIDSIGHFAASSRSILISLVVQSDAQRQAITAMHSSLEKFGNNFKKEKEFVSEYIRADQDKRIILFSRR